MAVAIDVIGHTSLGGDGVSLTVANTLTVGNNSNRCLVALVVNTDSPKNVSSISGGGGGTWTKLGALDNGVRVVEIWSSTNPSTGSQTATVTFSAAPVAGKDKWIALYSLYNVDQTTPVDTYTTAAGNNTDLTVNTTTGNLALYGGNYNSTPGALSGCTSTIDVSDANNEIQRSANCTGSPSVTFTWANNATGRGVEGCNVNAAASAQVPYDTIHRQYQTILAQ